MPRYRVEYYELHTMTYEIEAADEAEAIAGVWGGDGEPEDDSLEYIGIADAYGMPTDHLDPTAIQRLQELGYSFKDDHVGGIRSIEEVTDE